MKYVLIIIWTTAFGEEVHTETLSHHVTELQCHQAAEIELDRRESQSIDRNGTGIYSVPRPPKGAWIARCDHE